MTGREWAVYQARTGESERLFLVEDIGWDGDGDEPMLPYLEGSLLAPATAK